jgi:hypothetical protein
MGTSAVVVKDADIARVLSPVLAGGPDKAVARLLAEPERAARIRAQRSPHTPQMQQFVEEFLRDDQPVTNAIRRFPAEDVKVGETVIPAGDIVYLAISAANRDAGTATRNTGNGAADAHVSFGHGPHYCLGAPLARLETRIALWTLFHRLPDLALAVPPSDLSWKSDHRQHALRALPVTGDCYAAFRPARPTPHGSGSAPTSTCDGPRRFAIKGWLALRLRVSCDRSSACPSAQSELLGAWRYRGKQPHPRPRRSLWLPGQSSRSKMTLTAAPPPRPCSSG